MHYKHTCGVIYIQEIKREDSYMCVHCYLAYNSHYVYCMHTLKISRVKFFVKFIDFKFLNNINFPNFVSLSTVVLNSKDQ